MIETLENRIVLPEHFSPADRKLVGLRPINEEKSTIKWTTQDGGRILLPSQHRN